MRAVEMKQVPLARIGVLAAIIGILVIAAVALILITTSESEADDLPLPLSNVDRFEQIKLTEDNIPLPVNTASPPRSSDEIRWMEENIEFLVPVSSLERPHGDMEVEE